MPVSIFKLVQNGTFAPMEAKDFHLVYKYKLLHGSTILNILFQMCSSLEGKAHGWAD
jgi:hypothetical protein